MPEDLDNPPAHDHRPVRVTQFRDGIGSVGETSVHEVKNLVRLGLVALKVAVEATLFLFFDSKR